MNSFAVSLLLVGALLLGCSGAIDSNGTDAPTATPMTTDNVLTTEMNSAEPHNDTVPTTNMTSDQTPTQGNSTTGMPMTTTLPSTNATSNESTSVMSTVSTQATTPYPQTTPTVQTTPTPEMSWKVLKDNKTCQLMWFSQNITIKYYNTKAMLTDVKVSVPFEEPLSNVTGDCSSMNKRTFAINFYPDGNSSCDPWTLRFVFKNLTMDTFYLTSLSFELEYDDRFDTTEKGQFSYSYISTESPLGGVGATIGKSFSCASQLISSADEKDGLSIVFEDVKLQPFADMAQGQFGESVSCPYKPDTPTTKTPEQSHTWKVAGIVVSTLFGVFFLGTVGFCYYVKKHQAAPSDTYSLMETY